MDCAFSDGAIYPQYPKVLYALFGMGTPSSGGVTYRPFADGLRSLPEDNRLYLPLDNRLYLPLPKGYASKGGCE